MYLGNLVIQEGMELTVMTEGQVIKDIRDLKVWLVVVD
jgi:hypothetical protein